IDGMGASHLLVVARLEGESDLSLFIIATDAEGIKRTRRQALDTHVLADVTLDNAHAVGRLGDGPWSEVALNRLLDIACIGQSAELLGLALEAFERAMNYLKERKQFGVPIGSFQALQH